MLRALVVQFTRSLVRRAIMPRELDFVLCTHTRCGASATPVSGVLAWCWRLAVAASMEAHFGALLERFSEGEGSSDSDDAPLAVRARIRKGKPSRGGILTLVPHVSGPNSVKVSTPLLDLERRRIRIQKAYLVSCTNSRSSNLAAAAACNKLRG
jgi:hypothetical protein